MRRRALTRETQLKPSARSRITNGKAMLSDVVDGRTVWARRYRDLCRAIYADQGGEANLSEVRSQLIRRFAGAAVLAEAFEARIVLGEQQVDIGEYAHLTSTLTRVAQRIGVDRRARNITPTLAEYLEGKATEEAAA